MVCGPVSLFIATGLSAANRHPDEGEVLEVVKVPIERAIGMVETGEITHAPTCVLLFRGRDWLAR
jgi:ADP-ribose pyrophosphatase